MENLKYFFPFIVGAYAVWMISYAIKQMKKSEDAKKSEESKNGNKRSIWLMIVTGIVVFFYYIYQKITTIEIGDGFTWESWVALGVICALALLLFFLISNLNTEKEVLEETTREDIPKGKTEKEKPEERKTKWSIYPILKNIFIGSLIVLAVFFVGKYFYEKWWGDDEGVTYVTVHSSGGNNLKKVSGSFSIVNPLNIKDELYAPAQNECQAYKKFQYIEDGSTYAYDVKKVGDSVTIFVVDENNSFVFVNHLFCKNKRELISKISVAGTKRNGDLMSLYTSKDAEIYVLKTK